MELHLRQNAIIINKFIALQPLQISSKFFKHTKLATCTVIVEIFVAALFRG